MIMKTAFLDTNVIDACQNKKLTAQDFNRALKSHNFIPVIGPYAIYEHARCYETKIEKMKSNFLFIQNLNPIISCSRDILYKMEYQLLAGGPLINPIVLLFQSDSLKNRISVLSKGIIDEETKTVIEVREADLKEKRINNWNPRGLQSEYQKLSFEERRKQILEMLPTNQVAQGALKQFFQMLDFTISDANLLRFVENIDLYPALRTLLYQHIYLDFKTEENNARPARDKFPDGIQLIEASPCDTFISSETKLITNHGKMLNPYIELINVYDLI